MSICCLKHNLFAAKWASGRQLNSRSWNLQEKIRTVSWCRGAGGKEENLVHWATVAQLKVSWFWAWFHVLIWGLTQAAVSRSQGTKQEVLELGYSKKVGRGTKEGACRQSKLRLRNLDCTSQPALWPSATAQFIHQQTQNFPILYNETQWHLQGDKTRPDLLSTVPVWCLCFKTRYVSEILFLKYRLKDPSTHERPLYVWKLNVWSSRLAQPQLLLHGRILVRFQHRKPPPSPVPPLPSAFPKSSVGVDTWTAFGELQGWMDPFDCK